MLIETFKLLKSETLPLTPELAAKFRDMEASPTERALDKSRIKHLTEKAEAGLFVSPTWAIAQVGSRKVRVNGQHSSTVLANLNGNFPDGLQVHIDHYHVKTEQELAVLYRQFDDRKSGRSSADVAAAYQGVHPGLHGIQKASAKLAIDGAAWWRRNVEGVPVPVGDDVYELFGEPGLHPFLHWIGELFTIKTPELRRPPIVAALYATMTKVGEDAKTFWGQVARGGVEYEESHPATVLDNWLKQLREEKDDQIKPGNFYQGCVFAWNAVRDEKTITSIKYDLKKGFLPIKE